MFKLATEFYRLPLALDPARLAVEVSQFAEAEWRAHPQGHAGNSALPLVSVRGGMNDEVKGPMRPTAFLERCPYLQQALAALGTVIGRARLMRIAGQSDATEHVDTNYYWMHHVRVHIPAVTHPPVRFVCHGQSVHMAAGECWIFDSWKRHNVLNPVDEPRIHLVADTVGSASFWDLVENADQPCLPGGGAGAPRRQVPWEPGRVVEIAYEEENYPLVMSPWEQQALAARMLESLTAADRASESIRRLGKSLERLHREWHSLWTGHGRPADGIPAFTETIRNWDAAMAPLAGSLTLENGVPLAEALRQAIVRPAVNPEVAQQPAPRRAAPPVEDPFARPVFIVAAPRTGSSLLFELLARSPDFWTVGGESHGLFENIPELHPGNRGWESNRLVAADAGENVIRQLRAAFLAEARDSEGKPLPAASGGLRLLEKTPKNALRLPFLAAAFPDALFIYLSREPEGNVSSILEAWRSRGFITYPDLPGWSGGDPWSLLLVPGWRPLAGLPLAEIAARQWTTTNDILLGDLAALPPARWRAVSYEQLVREPLAVAASLCAFANVRCPSVPPGPLPLSRHTLTPPAPDKWRINEAVLASVLPLTHDTARRARATLGEVSPPMPDPPVSFDSSHTTTFPELLASFGISLAISTYQAGKLIFLRSEEGVLNTHFRDFFSPMGLAWKPGILAVGARHEVSVFRAFPGAPATASEPASDTLFLPATRYSTGDIRIHEIAWAGNELWAVNTRFSCLCTFDGLHSFVPRWRPPFVTALAAEDRCHLNGLAIVEGEPAYVTCHGISNQPEGWREGKAGGGCLLEVQGGEVIASGLSMPHSPRFYDGRLWVLESGRGRLSTVDLDSGRLEAVAELPGFTRGLDFYGQYAFIGLSQVRESAIFAGVPITEAGRERECGVWVVDIRSGQTVAFVKFSGLVQEIFSVQVLPGMRLPDLVTDVLDERVGESFMVPPESIEQVNETAG